jgi:hypothetical protein
MDAVEAMARDAADLVARLRAHDAGLDVRPDVMSYVFKPVVDEARRCLRDPPALPRGRGAWRDQLVPLPELCAAGWRLVPVPRCRAPFAGARAALTWYDPYGLDWLAIPPDGSPERARTFRGRGLAQAWMSGRYRAERGKAG